MDGFYRSTLLSVAAIVLLLATWFPEMTGRGLHKQFNQLKAGWEQIRD